ncbi:LysM peptidoglycan-binding domain-containing protein [Cryobacterium sp. Hh7]|uniref:LysM peptidoglycan-binding domain-containing protein n=1 Tax=Cryobacterium sp. Hh7 TaxID=1259159 RepID=UPI001069E1CB|nr:LysM domain-containing protein [Cryobacterium sp. Hh7]TFD53646.1 LysM peptidoglycan-binding domain-containing protein [Cryobacterium sp. Hh7]
MKGSTIRTVFVRRPRGIAVAALLLVALVGCAGEPAPAVTVTITPSVAPTPSPTPTPTPTPTEEAALIPNPEVPDLVPNAEPVPLPQGPAVDLGSTPGARGTTMSDGAGALLTYTVIEGDAFFDIAQRFNIPVQLLLTMNPSVPGLGENIYIKQKINLDWTTTL